VHGDRGGGSVLDHGVHNSLGDDVLVDGDVLRDDDRCGADRA